MHMPSSEAQKGVDNLVNFGFFLGFFY